MEQSKPQTPENNAVPLPPDTVPFNRHTSQPNYRTGDLKSNRTAVLTDLGRILTVPFDRLMTCIDETHSVDLEKACDTIMRDLDNALFSNETGQIRWRGFPSPPSRSNLNEEETFKPLCDILNVVFANVQGCGLSVVMNGHCTPLSQRQNRTRPDAFLIRSRSRAVTPSSHWFDIAVPFELKKSADTRDTDDDRDKIIWSLHSIMREDPCRRFAFGITIEDSNLRLWLSNRAFLAASQPINFLDDIQRTIRLLTSLASASVTRDMEGLGWDPTVQRKEDGPESWQYVFTVGNEMFTTTKELATWGADSLVGRGTRVYEAKDSKGNTVAIKDSWREADRKPEGEILKEILKSCEVNLTKEEADEAKKSFIQIKLYSDVYISDRSDVTGNPMEGVLHSSYHWIDIDFKPAQTKSSRRHLSSIGGIPDSGCTAVMLPTQLGHVRRKDTGVPRRVHTRAVFSDVGVPLRDITNLKTYFSCLKDAARALYLLHRAGWVHRDFSVGNVIRIRDQGKLGDFEYAKEVDSNVSHDVRTGTLNFMSVEVEPQTYIFLPVGAPEVTAPPPFRMNFLHDFESVWWTFAWALFYYTDKNSDNPRKAEEQYIQYQDAFPSLIQKTTRLHFFNLDNIRDKACKTLCGTCSPLSQYLRSFSVVLRRHYYSAEAFYPQIKATPELLEELYIDASKILADVVDDATNVELCPVQTAMARPKRQRDDEEWLTGPVEKKRAHYC